MSEVNDQYLKDVIKKENFTIYDIEKVPINTNGGNYLGELFEVNINGKTKTGYKELSLFVKTKINKDVKIISVNDAFSNEAFFYNELIVKYNELQESAKVPINERYKTAISYGNNDTDAIILQNLTKEGFTTGDRMDCVSFEYAQAAIQQLAKFHGLSFVLKEREPKYFEDKIKPLKYMFKFDDKFEKFYKSVVSSVLVYFKEDERQKIEESIPSLIEKFKYYIEDSESTVFCLCHGDYRLNNIMQRDLDGTLDVMPLDYQILHYSCPITDFLYFMSLGTTREFREKYLHDLKNLYYDTMADFLGYFKIDIETVYPREEFERVYKERLDYILISILFYGTWTFASEDELPKVEDLEPTVVVQDEGVKRVKEAYYEFVERGYIN